MKKKIICVAFRNWETKIYLAKSSKAEEKKILIGVILFVGT